MPALPESMTDGNATSAWDKRTFVSDEFADFPSSSSPHLYCILLANAYFAPYRHTKVGMCLNGCLTFCRQRHMNHNQSILYVFA